MFNGFEDCEEVIDLLTTLIRIDNLNILFIGDISSGKTTFINALIREYYENPQTNINNNENILNINSLKEQGISYYRNEVKTFCQTRSNLKNKKKLVILDDIDTINEQSQHVFRNYMDKYHSNVHFIASCCNSQKVIESLQSRCVIIKIQQLHRTTLKKIVDKIVSNEQIQIEDDALELTMNLSNNIKILINYIEKFKLLNDKITLDVVSSMCTNINFNIFESYIDCLQTNNNERLNDGIKILYDIYDKGYSVMDILDNFFVFVKITNMLTENEKYQIVPILCKYITVFYNIHEDELELALFTNNLHKILVK